MVLIDWKLKCAVPIRCRSQWCRCKCRDDHWPIWNPFLGLHHSSGLAITYWLALQHWHRCPRRRRWGCPAWNPKSLLVSWYCPYHPYAVGALLLLHTFVESNNEFRVSCDFCYVRVLQQYQLWWSFLILWEKVMKHVPETPVCKHLCLFWCALLGLWSPCWFCESCQATLCQWQGSGRCTGSPRDLHIDAVNTHTHIYVVCTDEWIIPISCMYIHIYIYMYRL